jgi:hypothetical protein
VQLKQNPCVKIYIVVYSNGAETLKREIHDWCRLDWKPYVGFKITNPTDDKDELTTEVIQTLRRYGEEYCKVYVQGAGVNKKRLEVAGYTVESAGAIKTLKQKIKTGLRDCGLEWRANADAEWRKSSIQFATVDKWYQQFSARGHGEVAKNLLKGLRVITDAEIRDAFRNCGSEGDDVGQRCLHAYVADDELGASSNTISDVLIKIWPKEMVCSLDFENPDFFTGLKADVLYVYEDGLWSGVELVDRLAQLSKMGGLMQSKVKIEFRYCAVADAGLAAARLAVSNYSPGKFAVLSADNHFKFIRDGIDPTFSGLEDRSDAAVREAIDASIEPYIFSRLELWGESGMQAVLLCGEIGAQLIKPFLEHQALKKAMGSTSPLAIDAKAAVEIPEIDPEKISKWKLGAGGFASTVVFQSSIPKPVLPLIWLAGRVELNGEQIDWAPLFWDSRRTGAAAPRV